MEMASCRAAAPSSLAAYAEWILTVATATFRESPQPGTIQWLNADAFVSAVDPATGSCNSGDSPQSGQFGSLARNTLRGPTFFWSDFYVTKWFPVTERVRLRFDAQFFNVLNHANFGLPSMTLAGIPGNPTTQTGFGALTYTTAPPTGLLGVGLGGDSSPRMIALRQPVPFVNGDFDGLCDITHNRVGDPMRSTCQDLLH
jgi:hypothetical protein